jgi:peptidoglycan/LPS O-acetylase OafA/YrhL
MLQEMGKFNRNGPAVQTANRSTAVDCLRGIAILWVLAYHFVPLRIFNHGTYGVLLFFIISGYCISFSIETSRSAWHFCAKRLGRLMPALIVCSFITTAFKHLAPQLTEPDRLLSWWDFGYTIIALPTYNAFQVDYHLPDGAYWSLQVEFQFYLTCFAIMAISLRRHLLSILCVIVALHTLTTGQQSNGLNDFYPFFIVGISVAALVEGRTREGVLGICFALVLDLYHLYFHFSQPSIPVEISRSIFLWVGTGAIYFAAKHSVSPRIERLLRPLSFVGLISYPLYLIHQDVGHMIINLVPSPSTQLGLLIRGAIISGLMTFLAWAIYFFVERKSIKPLTAFLSGTPQERPEDIMSANEAIAAQAS